MDPPPTATQFETLDVRHVERWLASRPPRAVPSVIAEGRPSREVHAYFDTPRGRLVSAGFALRVRRRGERHVAELVRLRPAEGEASGYVEELDPSADAAAVARAPGPVGTRVRALGAGGALRRICEVRVRESRHRLEDGGTEIGALVIEDLAIPLERRAGARIGRVGIAPVPGVAPERLAPFAAEMQAALGLRESRTGVCESVLGARGLVVARPPAFGPTEVTPASTTGETAFAVLRRHFASLLANEPGTRLGDDPRHLHDMRVASRRLRAAISLFREALPAPVQTLREELRWIAQALGEVRDLDVQRAQFDEWAGQDQRLVAAGFAADEIDSARKRMTAALDSPRLRRLKRAFGAMLRKGPPARNAAARAPIVVSAPDLVSGRRRKVKKAAMRISPQSPPQQYHELRILCKRMRYALEFTADVYGAPARDLAGRVAELQELLGRHQDAYVAIARIERVIARGGPISPQSAFAMGLAAERCAQEASRLRRRFPRVYARVKGKAWRRLRRTMTRLRPADAAASPPPAVPAAAPPGTVPLVAPGRGPTTGPAR